MRGRRQSAGDTRMNVSARLRIGPLITVSVQRGMFDMGVRKRMITSLHGNAKPEFGAVFTSDVGGSSISSGGGEAFGGSGNGSD